MVNIQSAGLATATALNVPMFSAWLAKETGDPSEIINAAYQIREEAEFSEARGQLREVRRFFDESDIGDANKSLTKIINDLDRSSNDMRVKYGIETRQGVPVTNLVQVYNTYAALNNFPELPNYNFKIKIPDFFYNLNQPRGFNAIYRNLTHDLSTVWSLGEARDILGSKVVKEKDAIVYSPKQERPRYMNAHTEFKSPM